MKAYGPCCVKLQKGCQHGRVPEATNAGRSVPSVPSATLSSGRFRLVIWCSGWQPGGPRYREPGGGEYYSSGTWKWGSANLSLPEERYAIPMFSCRNSVSAGFVLVLRAPPGEDLGLLRVVVVSEECGSALPCMRTGMLERNGRRGVQAKYKEKVDDIATQASALNF